MKGKLINKYSTTSKTTGAPVTMYVYDVLDYTADELADYQLTLNQNGQDNYRTNEKGEPLFFTSQFEGNNIEIVKGKTYDGDTNNLVDRYRPLSSEDFELKRSLMSRQMQPVAAAPARVRPNRKAVTDSQDAAF
jgi:hypothetical protein